MSCIRGKKQDDTVYQTVRQHVVGDGKHKQPAPRTEPSVITLIR